VAEIETGNSEAYDDRYLHGIALFNAGEYFDAHEVWEALWKECSQKDRRFYQSLIHATVSVYHWVRGNTVGSNRLYQSGKRYANLYPKLYYDFDHEQFWVDLELSFAASKQAPETISPPRITKSGAFSLCHPTFAYL
jgi:uncharacterized protein